MRTRTVVAVLLLLSIALTPVRAQQRGYAQLRADAERLYAQGSYALARELYVQARALQLPPADARWVDFRLADTLWRSEAATETSDSTKLDAARQALEVLVRDITRVE